MEKFISVFVAGLLYSFLGIIVRVPFGIVVSLLIVAVCVLLLVGACAWFYSANKVMKDYPFGSAVIQYSFVSISSIYIGDSIREQFERSVPLGMPALAAGLFVSIFCIASVIETKIPPAKSGDSPVTGRDVTRRRATEMVLGTLISVIIPMIIGVLIHPLFN